MTELELIQEARAYLPEHSIPGYTHDADGNVCARGAIMRFDPEGVLSWSLVDRLDEAAARLYGEHNIEAVHDLIGLEASLVCYDAVIPQLQEHEGVTEITPEPELALV